MRATLPYDPRDQPLAPRSFTARLGRRVLDLWLEFSAPLHTATAAFRAYSTPGHAAHAEVRRITLMQILFTGAQPVALVSLIGLLIGGTIIIETNLMAPAASGEILGTILVAVVLRELAPLVTAIIVASRSGTAIATELGNMKANSEILALASLGIDPMRFVVLPRLVACVLCVLVLTVYFAVAAIGGGYLVSLLITAPSLDAIRSGFAGALRLADLPFFLLKGAGLGLIVGLLCCHYGLQVKSSPTEVPRMASQAVVRSLFGCVAYNLLLTAGFYWLVGPPLR
ncbi:MAG: ABC transporter permease [Myxococcales bacterium]|nr:ABC transporter permease [Myxococcales bacterium]